jgi:acyl-CoA thioesterase
MMDQQVKNAIVNAVKKEPFAIAMQLNLIELELGRSVVEMKYDPAKMSNIYQRGHGGALFALVDEAFETASQTDGTIAVALNVNVTYVSSLQAGATLRAEAKRISQTKKTAGYDIRVSDAQGSLIATCSALAYRTGKPIPFL